MRVQFLINRSVSELENRFGLPISASDSLSETDISNSDMLSDSKTKTGVSTSENSFSFSINCTLLQIIILYMICVLGIFNYKYIRYKTYIKYKKIIDRHYINKILIIIMADSIRCQLNKTQPQFIVRVFLG